jgi:peptidoglycan/LPS O-acetylase OafA/YrhL
VIAALGKGYLAVDLFFVLSGFVIWYNYAVRIRSGGWGEARAFLWRRFARVWPLHGAVLAGFAGFALLLALTGRDTAGYPWAELPLHILLVQNWGLLPELAWNHPAWSISTELAAYLLFPALVAAWRWEKLPSWALLGIAAALALAIHALFALHGEATLGARIEQLGLWRCLAGFAMGMVLSILWQRWQGSRQAAQCAGLACALVLALAGILALPETLFVPAAFFTGLLALALGRGLSRRNLLLDLPRPFRAVHRLQAAVRRCLAPARLGAAARLPRARLRCLGGALPWARKAGAALAQPPSAALGGSHAPTRGVIRPAVP